MADDGDMTKAAREAEWSRWMAAAQDGDRGAYERLLKDCLPFLRAIAGRYHRTADRREDVVQDILLTLHRVRHTYDPARPFTHWLATIASRRSIDALRRRGRTEKAEIFDEQAYETFSDPEANREMSARDETPALQAAIASLPEGQREAVELLKLRELSLAEASQQTGKSVSALKVNMHRALKALRLQLKGD
ncbi:MAG TPA: sigma-70 family RNA polymerase sigma factor [Stellaceae bacterium]|jgi:RNA polymerase sigma-70 factor (ECF subfamily)|nr:sigma-70 family RNA polymerase sigma factor [Stellaceae bacterium]